MMRYVVPDGRVQNRRRQSGFLVIAAVFLIVVLSAYAGYLATTTRTQHAASAQDEQSARAFQSARAGIEWAAFQILRANAFCWNAAIGTPVVDAGQNLTFAGTQLAEFTTTVRCDSDGFVEGGVNVRVYRVSANACNEPVAASCPGALPTCCKNPTTTSPTYVERQLSITLAE